MGTPEWQPDIVVGIDFGMTCTGVAWSAGPDWPPPKTLQHWPGKLGHELRNKVDTTVSYDAETGELANWGFLCNPDDVRYEHNDLFKLYLDPNYRDPTGSGPTLEEARSWFRDYMSCMRRYIIQQFEQSIARFAYKRVEWLFSVPTTWRDPGQLAATEEIIRQAGYGQLNKERASVYLTEAEAAAVYTSRQSMEKGDVFLVCDAGGGTTDLNVLKVKSTASASMQLTPLSWTEGRAAGSTLIDYKVQMLITQRLKKITGYVNGDLSSVAASMMLEKFSTFKCSFGSDSISVPQLLLPVPNLAPGVSLPDASVEDSKLVLYSEELRGIFDEQVNKIISLIDEQLEKVAQTYPHESVSYLVMSGGLGTSDYVRKRIKQRYETGMNVAKSARQMKLLLADEPLLWCMGWYLPESKLAKEARIYIRSGAVRLATVLSVVNGHWAENQITWIVRQRYVCCRRHFECTDAALEFRKNAFQPPFVMGPEDQAVRESDWNQGDLVLAEEGARQKYRMKLAKGQEQNTHVVNIVMSALPPNRLPRSMKHPGAKSVCDIEFELSAADMKTKRRWYDPGQAYHEAEFDVRLIVGTGLRFEVWGGHGMRSKTHDEIAVQWVSPDAMETARSFRRSELYRA